jgi:hypothetical protein
MKFLLVLLMVPTLRAREVQTPATQVGVTLPQLFAGAAPVHPGSKENAQLIESQDRDVHKSSWDLHLEEDNFDDPCV